MIKKILLGVGILVLLLLGTAFFSVQYNQRLKPPELITNFVDLDQVQAISPYRSCSGHTVVPQDGREMKRNMKHYMTVLPEYNKEETVEIYAPYDGTVALMRGEDVAHKFEGELWIAQDRGIFSLLPPLGLWMVNFEHVRPRADLRYGSTVKAGELVAYASFWAYKTGTFDALYATMGIPPRRVDNWASPFADLDSVFNHMDETVLAEYERRGITRENIIISKEARDANPCVYRDGGPYFEGSGGLPNSVTLQHE